MIGRKGAEKYYILISLILGILILALSLFYIFFELFTEDDSNWEVCRQSIILRASLPEVSLFDKIDLSSKEYVPLKCKTQEIRIEKADVAEAEKTIMEILDSCWYLVGEGEYHFFASDSDDIQTRCFVCARITIDDEHLDFYKNNKINLIRAVLLEDGRGSYYWDHFFKGKIQAIPFPRAWEGDEFEVLYGGHTTKFFGKGAGENILVMSGVGAVLGTVIPGAGTVIGTGVGAVVGTLYEVGRGIVNTVGNWWNQLFDKELVKKETKTLENGKVVSGPGIVLPKYYDGRRGDMIVVVSNPARKEEKLHPMLLFLPMNDVMELGEPFATMGGSGKDDAEYGFVPCSSFETIPG
jgi:hypothetical protein